MIEILYRTHMPQKDRSECYVLVLAPRAGSQKRFCSFMLEHGYWDAGVDRYLYEIVSIEAGAELSYQDGIVLFDAAKRRLAEDGFVHSFAAQGFRKDPAVANQEQMHAVVA